MVAVLGSFLGVWPPGLEKKLGRVARLPFLVLPTATLVLLALALAVEAADVDNDGLDDGMESTLANQYAPHLYFAKDEKLYPVNVEYFVERSNLNVSNPLGDDPNIPNATVETLGTYSNETLPFYLDHRGGTVDDDGITKDYQAQEATLGYTVYAHVMEDGGNVVIQYWFFYAFNTGTLNTHEGDWETVMIVLGSNTTEPVKTYYSQHHSGQQAAWSQVEKVGDHPKVYVAEGSHANYYRWFQGRMGLATDTVGDDGKVLKPEDYSLEMLGETGPGNHTTDQSWLDFSGHWGDFGPLEAGIRGARGPQGPAYRANTTMWASPLEWGEDLGTLNEQILQVEEMLANFIKYFLTLMVISLSLKLLIIFRRQRKTGLGRVFSFFHIDGLNIKSMANLLALAAICLAFYSLVQPWYGVYVEVDAGEYSTDGEVQVFSLDGLEGIQINMLESEGGLTQLVGFPMPFAYLLGLGLVFMVLGTVGLIKTRKVGRKYLFSGIKLLIPVIIILGFISQAASVGDSATQDMPAEFQDLLTNVANSPHGGSDTLVLGEYGEVSLRWGLEEGGWLLTLSGVMFIVAGLMLQFSRGKMFRDKDEKRTLKDEKHRQKEDERRAREDEKERKEREKQAEKDRKEREKQAKKNAKKAGKDKGKGKDKDQPMMEPAPPQEEEFDKPKEKKPPKGGMLEDLL